MRLPKPTKKKPKPKQSPKQTKSLSNVRVLGLDPATKTGWAYHNGAKYEWGTVSPQNIPDVERVVLSAIRAGVTVAYIEDAYLGHHHNVKTLKSLVASQTRVRVECERFGLQVVMVTPSAWQASWKISGERNTRKLEAIGIAQRVANNDSQNMSSDEADAVLIAEYGRMTETVQSRAKQ